MKLIIKRFAQKPTDLNIAPLGSGIKLSNKCTNLINGYLKDNASKIYTVNIAANSGSKLPKGALDGFIDQFKSDLIGKRGIIAEMKDRDIIFFDTSEIKTDKADRRSSDNVHYEYSVHSMNNGSNLKGLIYDSNNVKAWQLGKLIPKPTEDPVKANPGIIYAYSYLDSEDYVGLLIQSQNPERTKNWLKGSEITTFNVVSKLKDELRKEHLKMKEFLELNTALTAEESISIANEMRDRYESDYDKDELIVDLDPNWN